MTLLPQIITQVLCTLKEEAGGWNAGQHIPVTVQDRLDLSNLDNMAPLFQAQLTEVQSECTTLEDLEQLMWDSAKQVLGVVRQARAKPFLNHAVLSLRKAI